MKLLYPIYCAGEWIETAHKLAVINPYTAEVCAHTFLASGEDLERAIRKAESVREACKHLPTHIKSAALASIADALEKQKEDFARVLAEETSKPISYARVEVERAIQTFIDAAEECKRIYGQWMPLDRLPAHDNHQALMRRFPIGLIAGISPFNFPLNLVAHKLAPAIAAGCPIILKPASKTPLSALKLAEIIDTTALPKGMISIVPMSRETGDKLITDDRFKLITFTGSPAVGWDIKKRAGKKKVALELGGNAAVIVAETADIGAAIKKLVPAAFGFSGQSCIHTQRVYAHERVFDTFVKEFMVLAKSSIIYGDPLDEKANFSNMIDEKNAARIDEWTQEAIAEGATLLMGGTRTGGHFEPTVLTGTRADMRVCKLEAFAPLVVIEKYTDFKEVIARVNDSAFGLQTGVFTNNLKETLYAFDALEVGGVIINNASNFRADHMPYGGIKDSGIGREGVRYALEDMTELKTLVINQSF